MIIEKIASDSLVLRKARDPMGVFLSTLLSDTKMLAKNEGNREATDEDAIRVIKKYLKSTDETITLCKDNVPEKVFKEKEILESLLPKVASIDAMLGVINTTIADGPKDIKQMGRVMAALKAAFGTSLDSKKASELVRAALM